MLDSLLGAVLLSLSLCMDCFAVSTCSSVTVKKLNLGSALWIALIFALVHIGLLFAGWAFGDVVAAYVEKAAHWIGFLLLLFVGGSMLA